MLRSRTASCVAVLALAFSWATLASAQATCTGVAPSSNTSLRAVNVATGLGGSPLYVTAPTFDTGRIFIVEQDGHVRIKKHGDATTTVTQFLDISSKVNYDGAEMGLLGMAFDPDYATTGFFYVDYAERDAVMHNQFYSVVARYSVTANPDVADPNSEVRILRFRHPQTNHNGGQLQFGLDGYLYISTGDGGNANDSGPGHATCGNGQSQQTLLGKMLRIDVRGIAPSSVPPDCGSVGGNYTIPTDNPFDDGSGGTCDEIWALGLRNPWRYAFDPATGDLYIGDVGQNCIEEVDYVAAPGNGGQNYGWRSMEGTHCFNTAQAFNCVNPTPQSCAGAPPCNDASLTLPVVEFTHANGECAVTGGYVYRGCKMPSFDGTYFYADYCAAFVHSFVMAGGVPTNQLDWTTTIDPGGTLLSALSSFGTDAQGEIYLTSLDGRVLKLVPPFPDLEVSGAGAADQLLLSKTGDWTWEDVFRTSDQAVTAYRVYRGDPNGSFACVHKATEPLWTAGGDTTDPAVGQLSAYVVTAVNAAGQETATGHPGTFDASGCP